MFLHHNLDILTRSHAGNRGAFDPSVHNTRSGNTISNDLRLKTAVHGINSACKGGGASLAVEANAAMVADTQPARVIW